MKTHWLGAAAAAALLAAAPILAHAEEPDPTPVHAKAKPKAKPKPKAVAPTAAATPGSPAPDIAKAPRMGTWGFDLAGRDTSITPGHDFFQYANGGYEKTMVIPADRASF